MRVKEIMTSDPACCRRDTQLNEVARMMLERDCGEIPIVDSGGRMVGVVTDRDIVCRLVAQGKNPVEMTADSCMSSPAVTTTPASSLEEALKLMEQRQIRRLPVVDENGKCLGMLSQADIARHAGERERAEFLKEVSLAK